MEIVFENPPQGRGRGSVPDPEELEVAEKLMAAPGEWARIKTVPKDESPGVKHVRNLAVSIRKGERKAFQTPRGTFQSTTRTRDGGVSLYVKFVAD